MKRKEKNPNSSLEVGTLGAWSLPPSQPEKQCFIYWASPKLSFEETVSKKDWKKPGLVEPPTHDRNPTYSISKPLGNCLKTSRDWTLSALPADLCPAETAEWLQVVPILHCNRLSLPSVGFALPAIVGASQRSPFFYPTASPADV